MVVLKCDHLTKSYGKFKAIRDLTLEIEENKITGLIGRNSAGKTTLLKIIAGHYYKTSGEIKVFSEDPFINLKVASNLIFIDDQMTFPSSLTLLEILESAGSFYLNWDMELAKRLFEYFSFHPDQNHEGLSKGKKSSFNIIIGLSARCPLTIFDEPTTGMDAAVRKDFYRALLKEYLQYPRTIILSSHLLNEIEDVLEDILLIDEGRLKLHMSVDDLREYATSLKGRSDSVNRYLTDDNLLFKENIAIDSVYAVIKNSLSEIQKQEMKVHGVEISTVDIADLCVYLTAKNKGGIDDVFRTIEYPNNR